MILEILGIKMKKLVKCLFLSACISSSVFALSDDWKFLGSNDGFYAFANAKENKSITFSQTEITEEMDLLDIAKESASGMKETCSDEPKISGDKNEAVVECNMEVRNVQVPVKTIVSRDGNTLLVYVFVNGATKDDLLELMEKYK